MMQVLKQELPDMPSTTFIATDPSGTIHTRKSESRTYTHTVVVQHSKDAAIERAHDLKHSTKTIREEFMLAGKTVEQIKDWLRSKDCAILCRNNKYATERQTKAVAFVAQHGTVEAAAASVLAERLAGIEAIDWSVWHNAGWCGRLDLAEKLAAKMCYWRGNVVAILPADIKEKKGR